MKYIRYVIVMILANIVVSRAFSQPGIAEFNQVTRDITRWYYPLANLSLIIGAICGLLGGLRVFTNWQLGRHHIDAQVAGWLGSCIFLSLVSLFIRTLYGV